MLSHDRFRLSPTDFVFHSVVLGVDVQDSSQGAMAASAQGSGSMTGSQINSGSALRSLIVQKEKELHDMNEYRIQVRCTSHPPLVIQRASSQAS
jgi:hypothetical protein